MILFSHIKRSFFILISIIPSLFGFDIVLDINQASKQLSSTLSSSCESGYAYNLNLSHYIIAHTKNNVSAEMKVSKKTAANLNDPYLVNMHKDLLIGIHHGSVQNQYLQRNSFGCPFSKQGSGYTIFVSRKNPYFSKSLLYAKILANALKEEGLNPSLHHTDQIAGENRESADIRLGIYFYDDLALLKNSKFPAIVLEPGVIVNPDDDIQVRSNVFKSKIVNALSQLK